MSFTVSHAVTAQTEEKSFSALKESILTAAKAAKEAGRRDALVIDIQGGWHYLDTPLVLSAEENPELLSLDITLRGKDGDTPKIHCFRRIELSEFETVEGKPYLKYQLPKGEDGKYPHFHNLFLNAVSLSPAKSAIWRNPDALTAEEKKGEAKREGFYIPFEIAERLASDDLGSTELTMLVEWEFVTVHIASVDLARTKEIGGAVYALATLKDGEMDAFCVDCHRQLNIPNRETYLINSPAFLTPNTYAYDYERGVIYVLPKNTEKIAGQFVQYPTTESYLYLEGLENFTVEHIEFTGTTVKYLCNKHYHSGQANTLKHEGRIKTAAVVASNMKNFTVRGCNFRDLGGNGLLLINKTVGARIESSLFENIGMSALSVGNPTTKWEDPVNRNFNIRIENNLFRRIGYEYPSALCVCVAMVDGLKVLHNTIEGCAYSAMSIGWGWLPVDYLPGEKCNVRAAEIAFNYIHNYMDILRDGGAIYVVGANAKPEGYPERFNFMHDNYAELDVMRDGSKYGYYCDGCATNWEVRHNVIVNCANPLYSQHHPLALSYHNHFFDNYSTTEPIKWFQAPGRDVVFYDCKVETAGFEALAEAYPTAREIKENAGCSLKLLPM